MISSLAKIILRCFLIVIIIFLSHFAAYSQGTQTEKEIENAISSSINGLYEQAIPVLKKYAEMKGFDDFKVLEINVYLHTCYFSTKNEAFDVNKINSLCDNYLQKYGIAKNDTIQSYKEMTLLNITGIINGNLKNYDKMIQYYSHIVKHYEDYNLKLDESFLLLLFKLSQGYLELNIYESAINIGQKAWKVNSELFGEKNEGSLAILEILYDCSNNKNEDHKSLEYILKYVELSKELLGEKSSKYLSSLVNLFNLYYKMGETRKALEINLLIVKLQKEDLGERDPIYIRALGNLIVQYFELGEYSKALEVNLEIVKYCEEELEKNNPEYLTSLSNLALNYSYLGDYQKALEIDLKVVESYKEVLGEKHPYYITSLGNLAKDYLNLGFFKKALEIQLGVVEIGKEVLSEQDPNYLRSLNNLAQMYLNLGDNKNALEITLNAVRLFKESLGENHQLYVTSLGNLAGLYMKSGEFSKSLDIYLKVAELGKDILGEKHPAYLSILNNLALNYYNLGQYKTALEIHTKVSEQYREILGEKHPDYLTCLNNVAADYLAMGNFNESLKIFQKVTIIGNEIWGENHPDYLMSLNNLAQVYLKLGNYNKSLDILLNVARIEKEILGEKHPDYLMILNNIASIYNENGNYSKALELSLKVVELRKDILGEEHLDYLMSLNNLAQVYLEIGDYKKSLLNTLKACEIGKTSLGEKHPEYLTMLDNLADIYSRLGDPWKAIEINLKVLEISKEILGDKHPSYLHSLSKIASKYSDIGESQKALDIYLKVAEISKDILGEKHPDYLRNLNSLAYGYSNIGNNQKALDLYMKVVELSKEILGEKHPDYLSRLNNLSLTEFEFSKFDSAFYHKSHVTKLMQERMIDYFSQSAENQRELFLNEYSHLFRFSTLIVESVILNNPASASLVYDLSLFSKGLLLNTNINFESLLIEKGDLEAITKFDELRQFKLQIQRLQEKPIAERYMNVDSLENIAQQKETELIIRSKDYGDFTRNLKISWNDVKANLKDNDVAIEFVDYSTFTDTVKYAALVLRKEWQYPRMIHLFRKDQIEEFIKLDEDKIYSNGYIGKQIKKLIWDPLEEVISAGERVYFSPTGIIHQLAIENLPYDDFITLGDRYQMFRLSSTKELAFHVSEQQYENAILYGGLQYDLPEDKILAERNKYGKLDNIFAIRGYSNDTTVRKGWEYLDGTLQEVEQIDRLMNENQYQAKMFTGETGIEESFKSLSGGKTGIIHFATHGFFLPIDESRKNLYVQMRLGDLRETYGGVDPMLRSGLMLSGGNRAWQGEKVPDTVDDGVLTAREISRLDLRGNNLIVLSACETGLGEVSSEGVFGLQRSFKQAGAKTLLMSLWQVNDEATRYLMTEFYSGFLSGKDKRVAFLEAKRKCKEKFPEPRYWAAFIMLD